MNTPKTPTAGANDGGPAFPTFNPDWKASHDGMTLRDWFAGQALAGMHAGQKGDAFDTPDCRALALAAYRYADAMLKAREASRLTANTEQSDGGVE